VSLPVNVLVHQRDGFHAAVAGRPAGDNPWKPDTLGHLAWSFGHDLGRAARPGVRLFNLLCLLVVVLPGKGTRR